MASGGEYVNQECFSNHKGLSRKVMVEFDKGSRNWLFLRCYNGYSPRYMRFDRSLSNSNNFKIDRDLIAYANKGGFRHELDQAVKDCSESTV